MAKVTLKIQHLQIEGVSPQVVLDNLANMKTELEALGCKVSINVDDQEIDSIKVVSLPEVEERSGITTGLCPECGCLMEQAETGYGRDENGEPTIVEIRYECPCCQYQETTYEG